jgi:hypothetical protein
VSTLLAVMENVSLVQVPLAGATAAYVKWRIDARERVYREAKLLPKGSGGFTPTPYKDSGTDSLWMDIVGIPVDKWISVKTYDQFQVLLKLREAGEYKIEVPEPVKIPDRQSNPVQFSTKRANRRADLTCRHCGKDALTYHGYSISMKHDTYQCRYCAMWSTIRRGGEAARPLHTCSQRTPTG